MGWQCQWLVSKNIHIDSVIGTHLKQWPDTPPHLNGVDDNVLNLILTGTLWTWTDIKKKWASAHITERKRCLLFKTRSGSLDPIVHSAQKKFQQNSPKEFLE